MGPFINAIKLKDVLCQGLREKSGLEGHRAYLGMSGIGQCPRRLYFDFVEERRPASDQQHWYCWTGYLHEAAVIGLLGSGGAGGKGPHLGGEGGVLRQVEVMAGFDQRFRGHVDYVLGNQVIEVKSVGWEKFVRIRFDNPQMEHFYQVQCYLRHGGWPAAQIVYVARDVPHKEFDGPPFWVFEVGPDPVIQDKLDEKARMILAAIDAREAPECSCGWCRK